MSKSIQVFIRWALRSKQLASGPQLDASADGLTYLTLSDARLKLNLPFKRSLRTLVSPR